MSAAHSIRATDSRGEFSCHLSVWFLWFLESHGSTLIWKKILHCSFKGSAVMGFSLLYAGLDNCWHYPHLKCLLISQILSFLPSFPIFLLCCICSCVESCIQQTEVYFRSASEGEKEQQRRTTHSWASTLQSMKSMADCSFIKAVLHPYTAVLVLCLAMQCLNISGSHRCWTLIHMLKQIWSLFLIPEPSG